MKKFYPLLLAILLLTIVSCGGGGSSSGGGGGSPAGDYNYLNQHNAQFNNGVIIRWQSGSILVNTNGISGAENAFRQWNLPFAFVNYNPGEGIVLRIGNPGPGICGVTTSQWDRGSGRLLSADIVINSDLTNCVNTITHEAGHAVGFEDHTSDGGLMDPNGGNGQITAPVRNMITLLYSLPVGTNIAQFLALRRQNQSLLLRPSNRPVPDSGVIVTRVIH
jgi:hypothetical protein